jgi:hypothetical protein
VYGNVEVKITVSSVLIDGLYAACNMYLELRLPDVKAAARSTGRLSSTLHRTLLLGEHVVQSFVSQ